MITLSIEQFRQAKAIAENMDRRIRSLRAANVCPSPTDVLPLARLNKLLDDAMEQMERELDGAFEQGGYTEQEAYKGEDMDHFGLACAKGK